MITLPPQFAATCYPGYYWNVIERKLYSIKVSGILTPIKYTKASAFTEGREGYRVSVGGQRRWLTLPYLRTLDLTDKFIPVEPSAKDAKATVNRILKETDNGK